MRARACVLCGAHWGVRVIRDGMKKGERMFC